jgi:AbrB family looped-hinge helix DNA binding protein
VPLDTSAFDDALGRVYTENKSGGPDVLPTMSVTLKPKNEITIPKSIRRKAGIKHGDRFDFSVSGRVISIIPKLSPDERQDEREIRDPKVRRAIQESNADIAAGRTKPADELLSLHPPRKSRNLRRGSPPSRGHRLAHPPGASDKYGVRSSVEDCAHPDRFGD